MTDKSKEAIAKARRAKLRKMYPILTPFFTTSADAQEIEQAKEANWLAEEAAEEERIKRREHQKAQYIKATTHSQYSQIDSALLGLEDELRWMIYKYEKSYWYFREGEIAWGENPLNKTYEDYIECLKEEERRVKNWDKPKFTSGYQDFGIDYKRQPFLIIKYTQYDRISIGYDLKNKVYSFYTLEPTSTVRIYRYSSPETGTGTTCYDHTFNPRNNYTKPDDWFIKEKFEFQTPEAVIAHTEEYLQKVIGNIQAEMPRMFFTAAKGISKMFFREAKGISKLLIVGGLAIWVVSCTASRILKAEDAEPKRSEPQSYGLTLER